MDDEPEVRAMLSRMLEQEGYAVTEADGGQAALDAYRKTPHDAVITDMRMPQMDGLALIRKLKRLDDDAALVVLTGFGELDNAVAALHKYGVYHYLTKPLEGPDVLFSAVNGAIEKRRLQIRNKALVSKLLRSNQILVDLNQQLNKKIIEQRHTEEALLKSERNAQIQLLELELLYSSSPLGFFMLDKDLKLIKGNKTMTHIVGQPLEGLIGNTLRQISTRLADQLEHTCRNLMVTAQPRLSYLVSLTDRQNQQRHTHWLVSSYPLKLHNDTIIATCHVFQDITELRYAEQQIVHSKTMLQSLFDGISDPLVMVDRSMKIRMLNKAAKEYYDLNNYKDMLGKKYLERPANRSSSPTPEISKVVAKGKAEVFERPGLMDQTKIEKVAVYPLSKSAIGLAGAIIQVTDITETRILERQLLQNEKLASLGMLVAGIAHEINNPNGFITFNLPILRKYLDAMVAEMESHQVASSPANWFGMPFKEFICEVFSLISNMEHGAQRISKIVSSLRALAKSKTKNGSYPPIALSDIIEHVQTLVRVELKQRVRDFIVECPKDLPLIQVDTEALEQVLINLLVNASHAADKPQSWIKLNVAQVSHSTLTIEIQDNGVGMDEALQQKIFSPFFTTKAPGVGTGIGLSLCHSLVNSMGGTIEVESTVGEGSIFRLVLPVHFVSDPTGAMVSPAVDNRPKQVVLSYSV